MNNTDNPGTNSWAFPGYSGRCLFDKKEIGKQIKTCFWSALFDHGYVSQCDAV